MRKFGLTILCGLVLAQVSMGAAPAARTTTAAEGPGKTYFGVTADSAITQLGGTPALTALFGLGDKLALQAYLGLKTQPAFTLGSGATIKYTVVGDYWKGFHLGGGLGLGVTGGTVAANGQFYISIFIGPGIHYQIVEGVMLSLDAGATVAIVTGGGGTSFQLGGNGSDMLGASLMFRL